jgi:hypothetical protein
MLLMVIKEENTCEENHEESKEVFSACRNYYMYILCGYVIKQ